MTDPDLALREPQLAVLSVLAHGGGEVETAVAIGRAAIHAIFTLLRSRKNSGCYTRS